MSTENQDPKAPEGAHCAQHPERDAQFTCPRCGNYACANCWHPATERCRQCLARDPTEAVAPIAWQRPDEPLVARYVFTLGSAFRPMRSAASFARYDLRAALRFMLLSALPLALLAGVIPHTRTLLFAGNFEVRVLGNPSTPAIALDVARAGSVQALLTLIELACLVLPYASLVRAYAQPERRHAAVCVMFYRIWLMPAAHLLFYLALFSLPTPDPATLQEAPSLLWLLVSFLSMLGPGLLLLSMTWTARLACGLGPGMSMIVVLVPVALMLPVDRLANAGVNWILPSMPEIPNVTTSLG